MMKHHKIGWVSILLSGAISLMGPGVLADQIYYSLQCKTPLERFWLRLKQQSRQRVTQAYYDKFYQQTQDFPNTLKGFPASPSQIDKREIFFKALQDSVESLEAGGTSDLAPMPDYASQHEGRLATPALETNPKRELRQSTQSVRYVYDDQALGHTKEVEEGAEEADAFPSSSTPRSSRIGKAHIPKERELE